MFDKTSMSIEYNFTFNDLPVRPGMALKVKGVYGLVTFMYIAHDLTTNLDYLVVEHGKKTRIIRIERLMDVVIRKRTIRKKINESRTANC